MKKEKNIELRRRLLDSSVAVFQLLKEIPYRKEYDVLRYQLSKSATSIGANYEESQTSTYKEFLQKVKIALREANETAYWLKLIERLEITKTEKCTKLTNEVTEIARILGSIAAKVEKNLSKEKKNG